MEFEGCRSEPTHGEDTRSLIYQDACVHSKEHGLEKGIMSMLAVDSTSLDIWSFGFEHKWINSNPEQGKDGG
ncbi:hypothetical protein H5410_034988 [Solanum commersonii]|uniref:Uncharacterized protein n=1 Tax=Solanum commersonii TaxID=4109 RepID=A0A9J5Y3A9_SOLCO|nr:hypothetical protein H5410_034988 [Solanum commersonii]